MSTEPSPDLDLDRVQPGALTRELTALEKRKLTLVTVAASPLNWERIKEALCALRAAGISPLLLLRRAEGGMTTEAMLSMMGFLRDWDQLLLRNILEIGGNKIPSKYLSPLQQESRTELKWFQEWQTAVSDPRISRYPNLPWRSFLRKVNAENFAFAEALFRGEQVSDGMDGRVEDFLIAKKKTICVFPKNWSKQK